jgi:hypothetical protein
LDFANLSERGQTMSSDARLMCGLSLILVPTIVYGGLTVLGIVSNQLLGAPGPTTLSGTQIAFYRAGHAHAGVLTLLAVLLQITLDYAQLPPALVWWLRVGAIAGSIMVSGGFFAVAHAQALRFVLYTGAFMVATTTFTAGVGLIRSR